MPSQRRHAAPGMNIKQHQDIDAERCKTLNAERCKIEPPSLRHACHVGKCNSIVFLTSLPTCVCSAMHRTSASTLPTCMLRSPLFLSRSLLLSLAYPLHAARPGLWNWPFQRWRCPIGATPPLQQRRRPINATHHDNDDNDGDNGDGNGD